MENLRSAENSFQHTERMARKGYVTRLQRDAREFAVERAKLDLGTADTAKTCWRNSPSPRCSEDLESTRDTAEAKMRSEEAAFELEQPGSSGCRRNWKNAPSPAPQAGMVIYANEQLGGRGSQAVQDRGRGHGPRAAIDHPLARLAPHAGQDPRPRIEGRSASARHAGQREDPGSRIPGRGRLGGQPARADQLSSGTVKEYATIVRIDGDTAGCKPGMTAVVEILVAELKDVLTVPVEAVVEQGGNTSTAGSRRGETIQRRPVVSGMSNSTVIEIKDGLDEGDVVVLNPACHRARSISRRRTSTWRPGSAMPKQRRRARTPAEGQAAAGRRPRPRGAGQPPVEAGKRVADGAVRLRCSSTKTATKKSAATKRRTDAARIFDKIDTNSDGFIDAKEVAAARGTPRQQEAAGGGRRPGRASSQSFRGRDPSIRPLALNPVLAAMPRFLARVAAILCKPSAWASKACCCTSCARAWRCWAF